MSKYRILLIDDNDDARRMISLVLQPKFEVVEAVDGLDALSNLEILEPDIAIIDVMMPLMDGYQVCEAIRRHPRFQSIQVLFLSAYGDKETVKRGYAAGANLFMTKPVDPLRIMKNIEFTIAHEPPELRQKKYTPAEVEKLRLAKAKEAAEEEPSPPHAPSSAQPEPPSTAAHDSAPTDSAKQFARILLVDDDSEMLNMLRLALSADYEITTASNGMEAVERMVEYIPDLMIIDIMMPKMNGYQLLQSIRRNAYFSDLPVIVLSAKSSSREQEYALKMGASLFIAKPYRLQDLIKTLYDLTHAPNFRIRPKKLSIHEIKQRTYANDKERELMARDLEKLRGYGAMKTLYREGGKGTEPPKTK